MKNKQTNIIDLNFYQKESEKLQSIDKYLSEFEFGK